ncbi:hypothetical protein BKA56DRAFT_295638 [Ilyonectria sp. MPI-CAGE-AT-0026]|nr:hypothetical protein BKA56DRAFT_295638 [Ilyonectria sp. MPI-CAGE-AT-0026]
MPRRIPRSDAVPPPPRERIEQRDPAPVELGRQPRREVTANGGLPNRALIVQVLDVCVALGRPRGQRSASTARPATSTPVCETPACTPRPVVMCPGACWEMIITWTLLKVVRWLFSGAFGGRLPASLPVLFGLFFYWVTTTEYCTA